MDRCSVEILLAMNHEVVVKLRFHRKIMLQTLEAMEICD